MIYQNLTAGNCFNRGFRKIRDPEKEKGGKEEIGEEAENAKGNTVFRNEPSLTKKRFCNERK